MADWKLPTVTALFDTLHAMCNLLILPPENLRSVYSSHLLIHVFPFIIFMLTIFSSIFSTFFPFLIFPPYTFFLPSLTFPFFLFLNCFPSFFKLFFFISFLFKLFSTSPFSLIRYFIRLMPTVSIYCMVFLFFCFFFLNKVVCLDSVFRCNHSSQEKKLFEENVLSELCALVCLPVHSRGHKLVGDKFLLSD